jgi:colicin import membrane protein
MAEQKESSVLFSLKELMSLEEDRIKQEENERKRQEDAAIQARLDAERRQREDEEARMAASDEARRVSEQRTREDSTRLDAIRQAEIERARLDAENAARTEQLRHQQEHERQLHAMSQDKGKKKLQWIAAGFGVFFLIAVVGGGFAVKSSLDRQKALEDQLSSLNGSNDDLQKKLGSATTPEERQRLEAELQANQEAIKNLKDHPNAAPTAVVRPAARTGGGGAKPAGGTPGTKAPCNCTPGDPLCSCL